MTSGTATFTIVPETTIVDAASTPVAVTKMRYRGPYRLNRRSIIFSVSQVLGEEYYSAVGAVSAVPETTEFPTSLKWAIETKSCAWLFPG